MGERPKELPELNLARVDEARNLLRSESSISFHSARAHETIWMLLDLALSVYEQGNDHYIEITDDHWHLQHPVSCRLHGHRLADCRWFLTAMKVDEKWRGMPAGRYLVELVDDFPRGDDLVLTQ